MNNHFTIILYVVEGSEKLLTFCIVVIFREPSRMERLRNDVFIFKVQMTKFNISVFFSLQL